MFPGHVHFLLSRGPRLRVDPRVTGAPEADAEPLLGAPAATTAVAPARSPDATLVVRLKRGDPAAFDDVVASLRPRLFSFLARLSRSPHLAEDLLQETWLRLATHAPDLPDDTQLAPWLFTVARNLFVSHRRWALLDAERVRTLAAVVGARMDHVSPFDVAAASESERRLEGALAALPVKYREVLLLVAVERLEPAEAARVLGINAEALRQRLSRARAMLAERLADSAGGRR